MHRELFRVVVLLTLALVGCSKPKVQLIAEKAIVVVEKAPRGVHLEAIALNDEGTFVVKGTIHSEHSNEVVGGHLHISVVEPSGNTVGDVKVAIRAERALARQLPKRGTFIAKLPGTPTPGSTVVVEYHRRGA